MAKVIMDFHCERNIMTFQRFRSFRILQFSLMAAALLLLNSCVLHLQPSLAVPHIPLLGKGETMNKTVQTYIYVDDVRDNRSSGVIAEIEGEESYPSTAIGSPVKEALMNALQQKGFTMSESAPVIISGEVRQWIATVKGRLPAKVNSEASLYLEVFDPASKQVYSGVYHGSAGLEYPTLDEEQIKEVLGTSMALAINQILSDQQLMDLLASF